MDLLIRINELREEIIDALSISVESKEGGRKKSLNENTTQTTFMHPMKYYEDKVLCSIKDLETFDIELEFVETKEQLDIWKFFRYHTSSIKTHQNVGRNLKFFVRDVETKKYLGIVTLGSDIYSNSKRDTYIGWTPEAHSEHLNYVVNLWGCVSLQPIGFNYNVGKLLASLCFTREVLEKYTEKYKQTPAAIVTYGAFGVSAQYERLPYLKRIGETKGYNSNAISDELYVKACELYCEVFKSNKICRRPGRLDTVKCICRWLSIPEAFIVENGIKRSIYMGFTASHAKAFLQSKDNEFVLPNDDSVPTVSQVVQWWKKRWANQRYNHLLDTNRLQATSRVLWTWDPMEKKQYNYNHKHTYTVLPIHEYTLTGDEINKWRNKNLHPAYIAGFLDGDGTVAFNVGSNTSYISVTQCDIRPLLSLQRMFGGTIRLCISKRSSRERIKYVYTLFKYTEPLLKIMKDYSIMKMKRSNYSYSQLFDTHSEKDNYNDIVTKIKNYQSDYTPINETDYRNRLTNEYISGLFDAEGYVYLSHKETYIESHITLTQRSNHTVLKEIGEVLGYGKANTYRYNEYSKENQLDFIRRILASAIVKKEQLEIVSNVIMNPLQERNEYKSEVLLHNQYKYREYRISSEVLAKLNKDGKQKETGGQRPNRIKPIVQKIKQVRCTKGVAMPMEHRAAIALHTTLQRKKMEDTFIDTVREQLKTKTQAEVCRDMNLKRHVVYNIAKRVTVKTEEVTLDYKREQVEKKQFRKEHLTKEAIIEQAAISKRKLSLETMVKIIEWIREPNATPTSVYDRMESEVKLKNMKKDFTIDSIKGVVQGKTQPHESEYPLLGTITKEMYKGWLDAIATLDFAAARKVQMGRKVRSVSPEVIVGVFLRLNAQTKGDGIMAIAKDLGIPSSTLRRFVQHPELYYAEDFPVTVNGKSYTYEDFVCLSKKK